MRLALTRPVAVAIALALAVPALAADPDCEKLWTAFAGTPLDGKPKRDGEAEDLWRYRSAAQVFAKALEPVRDMSETDFAAQPKPTRMMASLGLMMGDRLMTCYAGDAAATDASYVDATEDAYPPETRADYVARFKMKD
jgi:hypothetical protein